MNNIFTGISALVIVAACLLPNFVDIKELDRGHTYDKDVSWYDSQDRESIIDSYMKRDDDERERRIQEYLDNIESHDGSFQVETVDLSEFDECLELLQEIIDGL